LDREKCINIIKYHLAGEQYNIHKRIEEAKLNGRDITTLEYILKDMDQALTYLKEHLK
jgi:hypothetical protein